MPEHSDFKEDSDDDLRVAMAPESVKTMEFDCSNFNIEMPEMNFF